MFQRPLLALYWSCIAVTRLMRYAFMTTYVANSSGEELDFEISIRSSKKSPELPSICKTDSTRDGFFTRRSIFSTLRFRPPVIDFAALTFPFTGGSDSASR